MTKPIIREHNIETNEIIEREMTDAEFEVWQTEQTNWLAEQAAIEAEAQAKAEAKLSAESKLTALGLTPEEIAALRG